MVVADGAAFGSEMDKMMHLMQGNPGIHLYLPESFEWILLKSGIINEGEIRDILEKTYEYVESEQHFSWEQYFTELLVQKTRGTYLAYSKRKLNDAYAEKRAKKAILNVMDGINLKTNSIKKL